MMPARVVDEFDSGFTMEHDEEHMERDLGEGRGRKIRELGLDAGDRI